MPTAATAPPGSAYLTPDEAAARLNVSAAHVRLGIGRGDFPGAIDVSRRPGVTRPRYRIPALGAGRVRGPPRRRRRLTTAPARAAPGRPRDGRLSLPRPGGRRR